MKYRTIVADPPWDHSEGTGVDVRNGGRITHLPYDTMTLAEIAALPVYDLSNNVDDDAHLYLWTTSRYLPDAFDITRSWGFHYAATLTWCKPSRGWSVGGTFQNNVEFVLYSRRPKLTTREDAVAVTSWVGEQAKVSGITEDDINRHMGTRRMAMWWVSNNPRMSAVPRWSQWLRLKALIGFDDTMDEAVREINARKGTERQDAKQVATGRWFTWNRSEHSAKPDAFLDLVEQASPGPYLEMFARRARFGWDYYGDESLQTVELAS